MRGYEGEPVVESRSSKWLQAVHNIGHIVYGVFQEGSVLKSITRIMVYKGHREISILVAPLFLSKKPYWWPQGGPYFKTSPY